MGCYNEIIKKKGVFSVKKLVAFLLALSLLLCLAACAPENAPAPVNPVAPPVSDVDPSAPTDPAPAPGDDSPIPVDPPINPDPVDPNTPVAPDPIAPTPAPVDPAPTVDPTKPSVGKVAFDAPSGQDSFNTVEGVGMGFIIRVRSLPTDFSDEITLNITSSDPSVVSIQRCQKLNNMLAEDGRMYVWGNLNSQLSLKEMSQKFTGGVQKVAFSNYYGIMLMQDGSVSGGQSLTFNMVSAYSTAEGDIKNLRTFLSDKKAVDIAATNNCYAIVLEDGGIVAFGAAEYGEKNVPAAPEGEKYVSIMGGTRHFVATTDKGTVVSWGHDDYGQVSGVQGDEAAKVYTGAKQTYIVNEEDEVVDKAGFKGYLMGTDDRGRDVFTRIIHGGKMTMTIGAVAVIVSTIIAIIVGCLSGYFGGWVDMLLMRITEIFASIPFLPFAMMLSYVIRTMPIGETTRIFIIMVILGLLSWTGLARMIRAQVLAEREKEFVIAAQSMGVKESRIAFKHILPNVVSVILVSVTLDFAGCLLTESSLSYLGFGVQQPQPTWGNMLYGANNSIVIQNYWWQWVFPAIFLAIATISINVIGDTMRDVLDPKSSQEK